MSDQSTWKQMLVSPPAEAAAERERLVARAAELVDKALAEVDGTTLPLPPELDCIVAGSGFLSLYFLGVHTILTQLQNRSQTRVVRYAGASSGAQAPFELSLIGEAATVDRYLSHGLLADAQPRGLVGSMLRADRDWASLADWMFATHEDKLASCDGKCHISVTHPFAFLSGRSSNSIYSNFSESPTLAREAFYATGTLLTRCRGRVATDGGVSNNKPRFRDGRRPALLVDPIKTGLPLRMAVGYSFGQAIAALELGQNDAADLLLFRPGCTPRRGAESLWLEEGGGGQRAAG